jgi:hypothetical protein
MSTRAELVGELHALAAYVATCRDIGSISPALSGANERMHATAALLARVPPPALEDGTIGTVDFFDADELTCGTCSCCGHGTSMHTFRCCVTRCSCVRTAARSHR